MTQPAFCLFGEDRLEVYLPGVELCSSFGEMARVLTEEFLIGGEDCHLSVFTDQHRTE